MLERIISYLYVYLVSGFKFFIGLTIGPARGLSILETVVFSVLGMMTTVFIVLAAATRIRIKLTDKKSKKKIISRKNRFKAKIRNRGGIIGIAFLTPVIFSPIVGSVLALSLDEKPKKVVLYMFLSAVFWAFVGTYLIVLLGENTDVWKLLDHFSKNPS